MTEARGVPGPAPGAPEDGAAAVEFALVLPVLVLVVFGIIEFGIVFTQMLSLSNGARQGARYGVVGKTCSQIVDETRTAADTIGMDPDDIVVTIQSDGGGTICTGGSTVPCAGRKGEPIVVVTSYDSSITIPLFPGNDPSVGLTGKGVYRCETG